MVILHGKDHHQNHLNLIHPFNKGDRIIYKKAGSLNNNKSGIFISIKKDEKVAGIYKERKYRILLDDDTKISVDSKYVYPEKK